MKLWRDYRLHLSVLLACLLAELIGAKTIQIGQVAVAILPMLFAMIFTIIAYLFKPFKWLGEKQAEGASQMLSIGVLLLLAKLGVASGESIDAVISAGPVLLLQNLGNVGTLLVALPIALLLGLGREAIGMTHSLGREANVALISDVYGPSSMEFKGVMTCYIVGTLFGTILMSFLPPIFIDLGIFSPESAAMAVGAGSASMMTAGLGAIQEAVPDADYATISAFASISNVISSAISVYLSIFIALPIGEWMMRLAGKGRQGGDEHVSK